jgi:hypothetical protein
MTSLHLPTDIEHRNCEHRLNNEASPTHTLEQLLLDSTLAIVNDGCEDEEEFASDDELIALLSQNRAARESSLSDPSPEPTVQAYGKTFNEPAFAHNANNMVVCSPPASVYSTASGYSTNATELYSKNDSYANHTAPTSGDGYRCGHYFNYHYPEAKSFFVRESPSQLQGTSPYYPTSEIRNSKRRPSVVKFKKWLDSMKKRLAELYRTGPTKLATNPGSVEHHVMKCKPCIFNQKLSGCKEAEHCSHCHLCTKEIFHFKEKTKVKIGKRIRNLADQGRPQSELNELREWMLTLGLK